MLEHVYYVIERKNFARTEILHLSISPFLSSDSLIFSVCTELIYSWLFYGAAAHMLYTVAWMHVLSDAGKRRV